MTLGVKACLAVLILLVNANLANAVNRTVGPTYDPVFQNISRFCNGTDPRAFEYGYCGRLIDCVYENISPSFSLVLNIGGNIAGLLPTILVLIGSPPLELIQLAMLSPHRALATCCFTIGLPVGLFRQLRPLHQQLAQTNPLAPRIREWTFNLSNLSRGHWKRHMLFKIIADLMIIALAGIMIWQNYGVNTYVIIPWRCEYTWLLIAWPLACLSWLILAVGLMFLLKEKLTIHNAEDPSIKYSIWKLMTLPYTLDMKPTSIPPIARSQLPETTKDALAGVQETAADTVRTTTYSVDIVQLDGKDTRRVPLARTETYLGYGEHCITVQIVMPSNFGVRSWRTLETTIEVLAVGIYLYATFVLMSLSFFTAERAIVFATQMAICLSFVRLFGLLF